jgi:CRISPR-associated endonuclease Csn1
LKQGLQIVPEQNTKGDALLLFHLSPNDLVYVPTKEEIENGQTKAATNLSRIYKIVSFTGSRLYAIPYYVAKAIVDKVEYTQLNKVESDIDDNLSIKQCCIKLKVDRLGNIR